MACVVPDVQKKGGGMLVMDACVYCIQVEKFVVGDVLCVSVHHFKPVKSLAFSDSLVCFVIFMCLWNVRVFCEV